MNPADILFQYQAKKRQYQQAPSDSGRSPVPAGTGMAATSPVTNTVTSKELAQPITQIQEQLLDAKAQLLTHDQLYEVIFDFSQEKNQNALTTDKKLRNYSSSEARSLRKVLDFQSRTIQHVVNPINQPQNRILYHQLDAVERMPQNRKWGLALMLVAFGGIMAAVFPFLQLEVGAWALETKYAITSKFAHFQTSEASLPIPTDFTEAIEIDPYPLVDTQGLPVTPVNEDFSLIIPSIGVNAPIIPGVNPTAKAGYFDALKNGVAHSSTSYYPNENGTVYLFSHSTNYEWFVKDLNAVFYLLKNLTEGNTVVVMYLGNRYTYKIRETKIVSLKEVAYLKPQYGTKTLILQTCWPPGSSIKRMLVFADLVHEKAHGDFEDVIYGTTPFGKLLTQK